MADNLPGFNLPSVLPGIVPAKIDVKDLIRTPEANGWADVMHDRLMKQIAEFEKGLDATHEVGAYLASFGGQHIIRIEDIGYANPYLITFYGTTEPNGERVQLVQHTTQLNVLLVALPVATGKEPRRIGFEA